MLDMKSRKAGSTKWTAPKVGVNAVIAQGDQKSVRSVAWHHQGKDDCRDALGHISDRELIGMKVNRARSRGDTDSRRAALLDRRSHDGEKAS